MKIQISELSNSGDARGFSFTAPVEALEYVGRMAAGAKWSFHWDEGDETAAQHREFDGSRAVLVLVAPGASHAVCNDGEELLWLVAISSERYDPAESMARKVV